MPKSDLARICQTPTNMDWVRVYNQCFPPEEQWTVERICEQVESGIAALHTTEDSAGRVLCFTHISLFEQFLWLNYMGVDKEYRGVGLRHGAELLRLCAKQYPCAKGIFFAIESTEAPGLDPAVQAARTRRRKLFFCIGAKHHPGSKFFIPNCLNSSAPLETELLWYELPNRPPVIANDLKLVVSKIYQEHFVEFSKEMVGWMIPQFNLD